MEKRVNANLIFVCFSLILLISLISSVSASGIESQISKLTSYAEEYESGNINYAQLVVYLGNTREKMNGAMGVIDKQDGGILKEEQLRIILGKETEKTRWAWNENKQREEKQKNDVPAWRKIVFDGNKIQIWLNAWPSIIGKSGKEELVYRLDVKIEFKKASEKFSIENEINEIKTLAESYQKDPSNENANTLAQKSVVAERKFQDLLKNNQDKCESYLSGIFGTENKMSNQKTLLKEVNFYSGEDFDVNMRLEMCDECEWHWINLDFWIESRGMFEQPKEKFEKSSINKESMTNEDFKREVKSVFSEIENAFSKGDYNLAYELKLKLRTINDAWGEKSNDAWKEVDKIYQDKRSATTESPDRNDPYYWVKEQQEKQKRVNEIVDRNYQERKQFYLDLVSKYETKDYIFNQIEFEKRLVEIFGEFTQEICSNNKDDNKDNNIDCADETCNGKICGGGEIEVSMGNETKKETRNLYCIMKQCKAKEEILTENKSICGNHICEANELESCKQDCTQCKQYDAINCSGKVIFKGTDENNCPLEPICIKEDLSCSITEDCSQPLCGKAECIAGKCQVNSLKECKEAECTEGAEKVMKCENGDEIVSQKCFDGLWKETEIKCQTGASGGNATEVIEKREDFGGNKCIVKEDCGNQDDVCSNGQCVTIPKQEEAKQEKIIIENPIEENKQPEESQKQAEEIQPSGEQVSASKIKEEILKESPPINEQENTGIVGNVIKSIENTGSKIIGFVINGFATEGSESAPPVEENPPIESSPPNQQENPQVPVQPIEGSQDNPPRPEPNQGIVIIEQPPTGNNENQQNPQDNEKRNQEDQERRNQEEQDRKNQDDEKRKQEDQQRREEDEKRRNEECNKNCDDNCERSLIVPCVQKCVFDSKCKTNCDSNIESCKSECKKEKDTSQCKKDCVESCKKGEGFNMQQETMNNKFEEAVFKLGGQCRVSDKRTEGGIYFDGWGKPFEDLRYLKQEYYSSGSNDWCKSELEDYLKQRKEFEKSMNNEFLAWFFENYMTNTAEDWEEQVSGIYNLYWKDVEFSKQIARTSQCSKTDVSSQFNLVNIKYESDYGKIEFWEEMRTVKTSEFGEKIQGEDKEITVLTPFMKIWIFPPKEFIISEMKKAMKEHKFPGKAEDKTQRENGEGPTEQEKEQIKQNKGLMSIIEKMSEKYKGAVDMVVQLKDYTTNEVIFNLYVSVNENDIIKMKPMSPEEVPQEDIKIEIDFEKIYDMIHATQKDVEGERIESPPWAKATSIGTKLNEVKDGIGIYFKVKDILDSATITPAGSEKDVRKLLNKFFLMMMQQGNKDGEQNQDVSQKLDDASSKDFKEVAKE